MAELSPSLGNPLFASTRLKIYPFSNATDELSRSFRKLVKHDSASLNIRNCKPLILRKASATPSVLIQAGRTESLLSNDDFVVVNFYHLVDVEDPEMEVAKHHSFLQGKAIHGRIYISHQGINAQYSGPFSESLSYANWVKADKRFKDVLIKISPSPGHAFPRLKLRHRPLLQLEGGVSHLPLTDSSMRAMQLSPSEWKNRISDASSLPVNSYGKLPKGIIHTSITKRIILLDVRNAYEWDIGHFQGAKRPSCDCFRRTTFGTENSEKNVLDPLARVDKEKSEILMYCTGGIRCDVYSIILRQRGFQNLFTLKGGIENYLKEEGAFNWKGNLFVFDSRLSVSPDLYSSTSTPTLSKSSGSFQGIVGDPEYLSSLQYAFGKCHLCESKLSRLRHRNCANLDCNRLILLCEECFHKLKGCCSAECVNAPRLRPKLHGEQRYERWHIYRDYMKAKGNKQ
eukprot:TRINITY_DN10422_c0_g1_i1.p1 TRINITY_DN10422_c0_g1~~TRINITY_DN10422_c0_g1_i1.p1  ORF type:complete len:456 (+),score=65.78 TRINITY_DN10422_c0_g1_i1:60-1427(+)